jgi:anti-sigma factor RsiW
VSCLQAEWLHGYFDGELDAARAAEFEAHLGRCASCTAALARQQVLRDAIGGADLYARASPSLRARVRGAIPTRSSASRPRLLVWPAATAAVLALALVGLWQLRPGGGEAAPERPIVAAILDAHLRSLQPAHLTDVLSSDQHTVKPWFDGKLDFSPPVTDLTADGFPLAGGRLDVIGNRSVAALVYGRRKHFVNLFVWPSAEGDTTSPISGATRGYHWIHWARGGMSFWAVSDAAAADLAEFARLLQR